MGGWVYGQRRGTEGEERGGEGREGEWKRKSETDLVEERIRQAEATIGSRQAVKGIEEMPAEAAAVLDQKADAVSPVSWDVSCKHKHKHSTSTKQLWRRRAQDEAFRRGPEEGLWEGQDLKVRDRSVGKAKGQLQHHERVLGVE
ncbi:hypothetical protein V8C42DRAFT_191536 [Trichoderma barbatum]